MDEPAIDMSEAGRRSLPFAARFQGLLIIVMFLSLALIAQQWNKLLYQVGLPLLMLAAFLQIAFGNIPPNTGFKKSMVMLAITWLITGALFYVSVKLAPTLIEATR